MGKNYFCRKCRRIMKKHINGYICPAYGRGCNVFVPHTINGKRLTCRQYDDLLSYGRTSYIKNLRSQSGKVFPGYVFINENFKVTQEHSKGIPGLICPECGRMMIQYTWGYGCSGNLQDKSCVFSINNFGNTSQNHDVMRRLLNGYHVNVNSLYANDRTKYSATIALDLNKNSASYGKIYIVKEDDSL